MSARRTSSYWLITGARRAAHRARRLRQLLGAAAACLSLVMLAAMASSAAAEPIGGSEVLGMGHNGEAEIGLGFQSGNEVAADTMPGLAHVAQMSLGFNFGLAVVSNGIRKWAVGWGEDNKGQLGNGKAEGQPQEVAEPIGETLESGVEEVAAAGDHAMALKEGHVYTWGITQLGEAGIGKPTEKEKLEGEEAFAKGEEARVATAVLTPTEVPGLSNVVAIAAGGTTDYAVLSTGEVMAWGEDTYGQVSNHDPKQYKTLKEKEEVCSEGGESKCLCASENTHGVVVPCITTPTYIEGIPLGGTYHLKGVKSIQAGEQGAYALTGQTTENRQLDAWGTNESGERGTNQEIGKYGPWALPVYLPAGEVEEVAPGNHHVLVLLEHQVYGWGNDGENALLGKTETTHKSPEGTLEGCGNLTKCFRKYVHLAGIGSVSAVGAGKANSYYVKEGHVYAWGLNTWGQLGVDETSQKASQNIETPTFVRGPEGEAITHAVAVQGSEQRGAVMVEEGTAPPPTIKVEAEREPESEVYDAVKVAWTFKWTKENGKKTVYKVRLCAEPKQAINTCYEEELTKTQPRNVTFSKVPRGYKWLVTIRPPTSNSEFNKLVPELEFP